MLNLISFAPHRGAAGGVAVLLAAVVTLARAGDPAAAAAPAGVGAEAAPALSVSPPLPGLLSKGTVVVPFHVDHMQILPVFGPAAAQVTPRIGHLHLTLDNAPWHWVQASNDLIVLQGLAGGTHALRVDLADANHRVVDSRTIEFTLAAP